MDRELGEYVCFAEVVEMFGYSHDAKGATQRVNVYVGKCDQMGDSCVSWNAMINDGSAKRSSQKNGLCTGQKSDECEFADEEPADDRRPQRDAQHTRENEVPPKNKSKAKATYTLCLPQHTRVLQMRVAVVHGPRVCLCLFLA